MKRRFTILTAALALLAFLAIPMGMIGQTSVTWPGTTALPGTATAVANDQNITIMVSSTNTYTNPIRIYANTTVTINALNDAKILSVNYEASSTGNYVTYAQNATVTPNVTPTVSGKNVTWTYDESANVTEFTFKPSAQTRSNGITITYIIPGDTPTCATPTFSPVAGTYTQAQNVSISCATEGATIYYTTNGDDPTTSSLEYTAALTINETTTVKAMAIADGYNNSSIASATYTITTPSTIAEVRAQGTGNVFTQGVVTSCVGTTGYIQDASAAICVYGTSLTVGDEITVSGTLSTYNGLLEITNPVVSVVSSGNTVNPELMTIAEINASTNQGWYIRIEGATVNNISGSGNSQNTTIAQGNNTVVVRGNLGTTIAVNDIISLNGNIGDYNGVQIANPQNVQVQQSLEPSVTVTPATINAPAEGAEGTLAITYENIPDLISFDYYFCDANGDELEDTDPNYPDWINAEINEEDGAYTVSYTIYPNDGAARTANIKVYTTDVPGNVEVYDIVTINQEEYVAPTYAELPFSFNSGRADIETTDGLYQEGLGTDYNASTNPNTQLKFDGTGDWLLLQFEERPGTLTFDIKGNSFSGGTFTVQTSEDGTTYVDLAEYTELGDADTKTFDDLGESIRYIKWIYTNKATGNVGLGNISLAAYVAPVPTITVEPTTISATTEETEGTLNVTYTAIETSLGASIYWYTDNTGTTTTDEPNWISADINETTLNVDYVIAENNGEARTAYLKVYGVDEELNDVYSNLVTINQAAVPQQYTLTVEPFENLELITFVNDEMEMEEDGMISVTAGDQVMLSIVADEGYVMETLMVNGVNHVNDIAANFTYTFEMPAEAVTISATAVEQVAPAGGDYVRITSLNQLTDGSIVVIAARYDDEHTNEYYAMSNATSGKPTGVLFTSTTSGDNEILPTSIVNNEDDYYWVVNETENGYTFTNAQGFLIGYTSSTNFATGGDNTEWTIASYTATSTSMVPDYAGFKIVNVNQSGRAFALNESHNYGPYSTSNMSGTDAYKYNFSLDFFVQTEVETETHTLTINGYSDDNAKTGYYLIASPVTVNIADVEGMTEGDFDLYYYDDNQELEWINYEYSSNNFTQLVPGMGYLYAKKAITENQTYNFNLTGTPYAGNGEIEIGSGWSLVGNPFGVEAEISANYYALNQDSEELIPTTSATNVAAMQGVFVYSAEAGTVMFMPAETGTNTGDDKLVLNVTRNRGNVIDRAIVRFGEGDQLPKFQLFENSTKIYFTEGNEDYAIVRSANEGEMPVSFKVKENGIYTLTVNTENVEANYLHLIDNMTGANIDLLATPSYSFEANTTDYANRFKLVFATGNNSSDDNFAFYSNGSFVINNEGNATVQVIDINGRIVNSTSINGNANLNVNAAPGVYMLRLVNGENVKTQKVVVR